MGVDATQESGAVVLESLVEAFAELDESRTVRLAARALELGETAVAISRAGERGMRLVGERYEDGTYFLSALIMAGEMFKSLLTQVGTVEAPVLPGAPRGRVLLGTVSGDIHDIGKNLAAMALRTHGFLVEDLGIDVSPGSFVEGARSFGPQLVGLSGLTSASYESMRNTVAALRKAEPEVGRLPIVIGGAAVNEQVGRYVRADAWAADAMDGVRICETLLSE